MTAGSLHVKRAYEPPAKHDGYRVLVDGVWPRGVRKDDLAPDWWARELAPSPALRRWFGHDPARWDEFRRRYFAELRHKPEAIRALEEALQDGPVTLVYGARDENHNQAVALREFLLEHRGK